MSILTNKEILEAAKNIRKFVVDNAEKLDDAQALELPFAFNEWQPDTSYQTGDRVRFNTRLYKCLQSHTSQADWLPTYAASLWAQVLSSSELDEIPEWVQPDSTNPYMMGDKVIYDGIIYESLIDNNVWSPAAYPQGWRAVE